MVTKYRIIERSLGKFYVEKSRIPNWWAPKTWEGVLYIGFGTVYTEMFFESKEEAESALNGHLERKNFKPRVIKEIEVNEP